MDWTWSLNRAGLLDAFMMRPLQSPGNNQTQVDDKDQHHDAVDGGDPRTGRKKLFATPETKRDSKKNSLRCFRERPAGAELQADIGKSDQRERKRTRPLMKRREFEPVHKIEHQQ